MVTPSTLSSLDTWCCCPIVPDEAEGCPEPRMDPDNPGETAACIVLIPGLALTTTETRREFICRLARSTSPGPRLGHFFPTQGGIVPMVGQGGVPPAELCRSRWGHTGRKPPLAPAWWGAAGDAPGRRSTLLEEENRI